MSSSGLQGRPEDVMDAIRLFDAIEAPFCVIRDKDGAVVFSNKKFRNLFGDSGDLKLKELFARERIEISELLKEMQEEFRRKGVWYGNIPIISAEGKKKVVDIRISCLNSAEEPYCVAVFEETGRTDHTGAFPSLTQLRSFGHMLQDSLQEVYVFDPESLNLIFLNRGAKEKLDLNPNHLHDISYLDIHTNLTREQFDSYTGDLDSAEGSVSFESVHKCASGSEYPVEVQLQLYTGNANPCYVAWAKDISERKRHEATVKELSERILTIQEEERLNLASEIHDDVGQLLYALKLDISMLYSAADKKSDPSLPTFKRLLNNLNQVVSRVREISYNIAPIGLNQAGMYYGLRETIENMCASMPELDLSLDIAKLNSVFGNNWDTNYFRVIQESVFNVLKHAKATRLALLVHTDGDELVSVIQDNGVGMDPKNLEKIQQGNSLGLHLMQIRASILGGSIRFDSKLGEGCRVEFRIPISNYGQSI